MWHQILLAALVMAIFPRSAFAAEVPVEARLFAGATLIEPTALNTEMTAQNLKTFETLNQYGVEMTYAALKYFNFGLRYSRRMVEQDERVTDVATEYFGRLNQDAVLALARISFLKTTFLRLDVFGGAGGSNTTFKIKTATQDGELKRRNDSDWFATPVYAYGASIGVGYKQVFLAVEAGVETNKVDNFKREGTVSTNVQPMDLGGNYVLLALIIDGIPGKFK